MAEFMGMISPLRQFAAQNQFWHRGMNENLIKMSMTIASSVISRAEELPGGANEGDMYISGNNIHMWVSSFDDDGNAVPAQWWSAQPNIGCIFFVLDEQKWYIFSDDGGWEELMTLNSPYTPVSRSTPIYVPGIIRPLSVIWRYVAGVQYAIPAGAPGSGAGLDTPPGGAGISFTITHGGIPVGAINFAQDSTSGTFDFPNPVVVNNALPSENQYEQAQVLEILSPGDLRGATGLNITIQAEIWERD